MCRLARRWKEKSLVENTAKTWGMRRGDLRKRLVEILGCVRVRKKTGVSEHREEADKDQVSRS